MMETAPNLPYTLTFSEVEQANPQGPPAQPENIMEKIHGLPSFCVLPPSDAKTRAMNSLTALVASVEGASSSIVDTHNRDQIRKMLQCSLSKCPEDGRHIFVILFEEACEHWGGF